MSEDPSIYIQNAVVTDETVAPKGKSTSLGLLIGQDIWQRVFTARTPLIARWGGTAAGIYCILYGVAGALIGLAASVVLPSIASKDDVYADVAISILPVGLGGLVLAAAVAAMMSTASGALIAAATVARADVVPFVAGWFRRGTEAPRQPAGNPEQDVAQNRAWVLGLGILAIGLAIAVQDVVAALTIAYDILVGGLLVSILGGLLWKRGTGFGATLSMAVGTVVTLGTMIFLEITGEQPYDGVYANEPIYFGLAASAVAYIAGSMLTPRTDAGVMQAWEERVAGGGTEAGTETGTGTGTGAEATPVR